MNTTRSSDVVRPFLSASSDTGLGSFWGDKQTLTFVDLFCGIGGFHSAGASLGMKCVFACDIDEDCRKIYKNNYGLEPAGDVCAIEPDSIPDHDLLCAGFPCQPFSIIGTGRGFADARGTLFFELAKIIKAKQPAAFVLENVRQLRSHNRGRTLARIREILEDMDYRVFCDVLNALHFGLPQKRERIMIVGFRNDVSGFDFPHGIAPMTPLSAVLEKNPDRRSFVSERIRRKRHAAHKAKITPSIWHENKAGNISSHPFSCALRAGASYNYLLVNGERRLTPREMLRLQGFPEDFQIIGSDGQIRKQAGNSVPVPMVRAVLQKVINAERAETQRTSKAA
jgi:DNA (cytosine-5)-methyltransferase 1